MFDRGFLGREIHFVRWLVGLGRRGEFILADNTRSVNVKKNIVFKVITQNQKTQDKANTLANKISSELKIKTLPSITAYDNFENSYKIEFVFPFEQPENSIVESIEKTDLICSPWTVTFIRMENEIELIFNKTDNSRYRKQYFNTILWAMWTVEQV